MLSDHNKYYLEPVAENYFVLVRHNKRTYIRKVNGPKWDHIQNEKSNINSFGNNFATTLDCKM